MEPTHMYQIEVALPESGDLIPEVTANRVLGWIEQFLKSRGIKVIGSAILE